MGRGKPFTRSVNRLISAGIFPRPSWMNTVDATRPLFEPISVTKPPKLEYPEDRLRNTFLQRSPDSHRIPVNLKARSIPERHIADKFVSIQMQLMDEKGYTEEEAYHAADHILNVTNETDHGEDLYGPLSNPTVTDQAAKLYLAAVNDSRRDQALHRALVRQSSERDSAADARDPISKGS